MLLSLHESSMVLNVLHFDQVLKILSRLRLHGGFTMELAYVKSLPRHGFITSLDISNQLMLCHVARLQIL